MTSNKKIYLEEGYHIQCQGGTGGLLWGLPQDPCSVPYSSYSPPHPGKLLNN